MITNLNGITIDYSEYTGEWTVTDYGSDEDSPRTIHQQADYMAEFHDDICAHVDNLCREIAAEERETDCAMRALDIADMRAGV